MHRPSYTGFLLCTLAFLPGVLVAQGQETRDTLAGLVFDEVTKAPLENVLVTLTDVESGTTIAEVVSLATGRFAIPVNPGHYWLSASREGYASSPPREVLWDDASESVDAILLSLRTLNDEVLSVHSQADSSSEGARVFGRIFDFDSGRPVFDAEVSFSGSGLTTVTDRNGMFSVDGVSPGTEVLTISHLAYGEQTRVLELEPGTAYRVDGRLSPDPIELEGIVVEATSQSWFRKMDGLRWRMSRGLGGEFLLAEELERRGHPPIADALRTLPGVRVRGSGLFRQTVSLRNCSPAIYLDGAIAHKPGSRNPMYVLYEVPPMDVEAIEVYKGPAMLPPEYSGWGAGCAIAIWTKRGR